MATLISNLPADTRHSLRALLKTPAFTAGAVITVALAIGAATAVFSVIYAVLIRQLPYRDAERVFWIWSDQPGRDRTPFNVPDFLDYRASTQNLSGFAGYFAFNANLSDEAAGERIPGIRATGNFFDVLGARSQLGRLLRESDEQPGNENAAVLTHSFWMRRFGGDHSIVGRPIRLNGEEYVVVGVLAPGFATPIRDVDFVLPFAPWQDPRRNARNSINFIHAVGRLAQQVTPDQAASELTAIARRLQERYPVENARRRGVRMVELLDGIGGPFRTALMAVFAAVGAVLLIACGNLANLMLTRAAARRKDLALQLALGSSRARLVQRVLVEALIVSVSGGLLGALAARWGAPVLAALAPAQLPRTGEIRVDATVLFFSLAVSSLTGLLFGVVPALASTRVDPRDGLQDYSRGVTTGKQRIRGVLVGFEVALAVVLLISVSLLGKSFAKVQAVAPGFDATGVLSARLTLPEKRFNSREAIITFQRALDRQLSSLPAATHAGAISLLPLTGLLSRVPFTVEGRVTERQRVPVAQYRIVSPGYFDAARIPIRNGRTFSNHDNETSRPVAVVSEALARHWLEGIEPIGARLLVDDNDTGPRPIEIIGVAGNVQQVALDGTPTWDLYLPYSQLHPDNAALAAGNMFWIVRTKGDPMNLAAELAREVRRIDADVVASQLRPMDHYLSDAVAPRRFSLSLMAGFGLTAVALAVVGIYSVVTYSASQRTREIAIRVALGATRPNILRVVIGDSVRFILIGLSAGVILATAITRLLSNLLFGLGATDASTFGESVAVVAFVSLLTSVIAALRMARPAVRL